jgi:hypothetical protein
MRQVDVGDAHVGKAKFGAPGLDGTGKFGWVWRQGRHERDMRNNYSTSFPRRREPNFACAAAAFDRSDTLAKLDSRLRGNDVGD